MPMVFWGPACRCLWGGGNFTVLLSAVLAGIVAARSLLLRTVGSDRLTFKFLECMNGICLCPALYKPWLSYGWHDGIIFQDGEHSFSDCLERLSPHGL